MVKREQGSFLSDSLRNEMNVGVFQDEVPPQSSSDLIHSTVDSQFDTGYEACVV